MPKAYGSFINKLPLARRTKAFYKRNWRGAIIGVGVGLGLTLINMSDTNILFTKQLFDNTCAHGSTGGNNIFFGGTGSGGISVGCTWYDWIERLVLPVVVVITLFGSVGAFIQEKVKR